VKHNDGFHREEIHPDFLNPDINKRIVVDKETFKSDIDRLKSHCQLLMSQIITIGFKQYFEPLVSG
jgi:hypothetical protein